jgi:cytosine/adenosine deaminase-related metal-dependent hydrolase
MPAWLRKLSRSNVDNRSWLDGTKELAVMNNRDILIRDALIVTSRSDKPVGYLHAEINCIRIKDGKIDAIEPNLCAEGEEVIECKSGELIAMPGFVDAHNHSRQMALQAFPESGWKVPDSLPKGKKEMRAIFRWFLLEALRAGVTFICDWPEHPDLWNPAPLDQVLQKMKLRGCIRVLLPHDRGASLPHPQVAAKRLRATFCRLGDAAKERIIQLAVWVPEEDKPEFNRPVLSFLGNLRSCMGSEPLFFQMHLAESRRRRKACARALDKLIREGLAKSSGTARTVFIHAIWIDDRDLCILADRKNQIGVVTCPKFSGGRIAPIKELLNSGVPVGLGSDVSLPDPFALVRKAVSIHRSREESKQISYGEAFHMATLGGAKIFGVHNQTGSIEKGKDADIVLVRNSAAIDPGIFLQGNDRDDCYRRARIKAVRRLLARNVIRREHVDTVIVRGEKLVEKGRLRIDGSKEERIEKAGRIVARSIMNRLRESSAKSPR